MHRKHLIWIWRLRFCFRKNFSIKQIKSTIPRNSMNRSTQYYEGVFLLGHTNMTYIYEYVLLEINDSTACGLAVTSRLIQCPQLYAIWHPRCYGWQASFFIAYQQSTISTRFWASGYIESILPKGPYLPCVSMTGRALLAWYHRYRMCKQIISRLRDKYENYSMPCQTWGRFNTERKSRCGNKTISRPSYILTSTTVFSILESWASVYWIKAKKLYIINIIPWTFGNTPCEQSLLYDYILQTFKDFKNYSGWLVESLSYQCSHPNLNLTLTIQLQINKPRRCE